LDANNNVIILTQRNKGVSTDTVLAVHSSSCGMMAHMSARLYISPVVFALLIILSGSGHSTGEYWSMESFVDDNSGETIAWLRQQSVDSIPAESGTETVYPVMGFQCSPGTDPNIRLRIDWRRFIASFNTEVGFRVDGGKPLWLKLGVGPKNKVTMSKSSADVRKLLQQLSNAATVELEVAPYSEPSVFVDFDISTFSSAFTVFRESCQ